MPQTITFEREKLNQAMYQKLKRFIMNKRKREAEERAQADYYKRLIKEREERRRHIQFSTESLENARREIGETKKRLTSLKVEKDRLFTRFKQITQEVKHRDADSRARTQQLQLTNSGVYSDHLQKEALYLLAKAASRNLGNYCQQDVVNQTNALRRHVVQLYEFAQHPQASSSSSINTPHEPQGLAPSHGLATGAYEGQDKRQHPVIYSQTQQQQQTPNTNIPIPADILSNTLFGNRDLSAQDFQNLSKYLAEFSVAGGKLQTEADVVNAVNAGAMSAFLNNPKFAVAAAAVAAAASQQQQQQPQQQQQQSSSSAAPTAVQCSSSASGGTFLPPAPTGYRGSITTGQSAQQIQLAAAQQQAAVVAAAAAQLYGSMDYSAGG